MEFEFCETKFELKSKIQMVYLVKINIIDLLKTSKAYDPELSRLEIDADSQDEGRHE